MNGKFQWVIRVRLSSGSESAGGCRDSGESVELNETMKNDDAKTYYNLDLQVLVYIKVIDVIIHVWISIQFRVIHMKGN